SESRSEDRPEGGAEVGRERGAETGRETDSARASREADAGGTEQEGRGVDGGGQAGRSHRDVQAAPRAEPEGHSGPFQSGAGVLPQPAVRGGVRRVPDGG